MPDIAPITGAAAPATAVPAAPAAAPRADLPAELRNAQPGQPQPPRAQAAQEQPVQGHSTGYKLAKAALIVGRVLLGIGSLGLTEATLFLIRAAERVAAEPDVPAPRVPQPATPPASPTAAQSNSALMKAINEGAPLPEAHQAAINEAVAELHERYGDAIPGDATMLTLPSSASIRYDLNSRISRLDAEIQPEQLKNFVKELTTAVIRKQAVISAADAIFAEVGFDAKGANQVDHLLKVIPGLREAVNTSANIEQLNAAVDAAKDGIRTYAERHRDLANAMTNGKDTALRLLAEGLGVSEAVVRQRASFTKLDDSFKVLAVQLDTHTPPLSAEEINTRFTEKAAAFVQKKLELYYSVDSLGLSPQLADKWKDSVLAQDMLSQPDMFRKFTQAASSVNAQSVLDLLQQPGSEVSVEMLYARLQTLCIQLDEALVTAHGGQAEWLALGEDGRDDARFFSSQAMLDAVPGLRDALLSDPARFAELKAFADQSTTLATDSHLLAAKQFDDAGMTNAKFAFNINHHVELLLVGVDGVSPKNATLAQSILDPEKLPFAHRQALSAVIAETRLKFGENSLPDDFRTAPMPDQDNDLGHLLQQRVATAEQPVGATQLAELARDLLEQSALHGVGRNAVGDVARAGGAAISDAAAGDIFAMLLKRHPDIGAALTDGDTATMLGFLNSVKNDLEAAIAIRQTLDGSKEAVIRTLASLTKNSEEQMRTTLSGELFQHWENTWKEAMRDAAAGFDIVSAADTQKEVAGREERVIVAKRETWTNLFKLDLSRPLIEAWQERTLSSPRIDGEAAEFADAYAIAASVEAEDLAGAIHNADLTVPDLSTLLVTVAQRLSAAFDTTLAGKSDMDTDATERVTELSIQALLDKSAGLREALIARRDKIDGMLEWLAEQQAQARAALNANPDQTQPRLMLDATGKAMTIIRTIHSRPEV